MYRYNNVIVIVLVQVRTDIVEPKMLTVNYGDNATFTCHCETAMWWFQNDKLLTGVNHTIEKIEGNTILSIYFATYDNAGNYTCHGCYGPKKVLFTDHVVLKVLGR